MPFVEGRAANPLGAGNAAYKLALDMRKRFAADFKKHGMGAIIDLREKDPGRYLQIGVSLLPKEMTLSLGPDFSSVLADAAAALTSARKAEKAIPGQVIKEIEAKPSQTLTSPVIEDMPGIEAIEIPSKVASG